MNVRYMDRRTCYDETKCFPFLGAEVARLHNEVTESDNGTTAQRMKYRPFLVLRCFLVVLCFLAAIASPSLVVFMLKGRLLRLPMHIKNSV